MRRTHVNWYRRVHGSASSGKMGGARRVHVGAELVNMMVLAKNDWEEPRIQAQLLSPCKDRSYALQAAIKYWSESSSSQSVIS